MAGAMSQAGRGRKINSPLQPTKGSGSPADAPLPSYLLCQTVRYYSGFWSLVCERSLCFLPLLPPSFEGFFFFFLTPNELKFYDAAYRCGSVFIHQTGNLIAPFNLETHVHFLIYFTVSSPQFFSVSLSDFSFVGSWNSWLDSLSYSPSCIYHVFFCLMALLIFQFYYWLIIFNFCHHIFNFQEFELPE